MTVIVFGRSYETDGDRYVAFKDQMYGTSGALVASGVEGGNRMEKDGSGAAGIFGNGSGKRRYGK